VKPRRQGSDWNDVEDRQENQKFLDLIDEAKTLRDALHGVRRRGLVPRAAHRTVMSSVVRITRQYENNRAEVSHQPTRQRERQMRRFKSAAQAQRFLSVHGLVQNLFRVRRHQRRGRRPASTAGDGLDAEKPAYLTSEPDVRTVIVGVDTHKYVHVAVVIDTVLAATTFWSFPYEFSPCTTWDAIGR